MWICFSVLFQKNNIDVKKIKNANDLLIHRGPDHSGYVLIDDKNKPFLFTDEKYKSLHSKIDSIEEESKLLKKDSKFYFLIEDFLLLINQLMDINL